MQQPLLVKKGTPSGMGRPRCRMEKKNAAIAAGELSYLLITGSDGFSRNPQNF